MDPNLLALLGLGYLWWKGKHKPSPNAPAAKKQSGPLPNAPAPKSGPDAPVPPGYESAHHTTGLHGEPGIVYMYANHDEWFVPDNHALAPYHIPGGEESEDFE